ncbi:uncharacterized protein LOC116342547 [Contarinia nasturtii]|uniref:uncharacterized protein LOC116342547 n=1 Tax=Contarinia nasturtii TaxID=265458 RepID=UPI0012D40B76|nr:uncharacterized protein LOC116342547 [Contarinia nasturtii]
MEQLRPSYLKLLTQTLKENVKKTSELDLNDMALTHFGMNVEERCFNKNRNVASYSRAITASRLEIERYTSRNILFPMIDNAMKVERATLTDKRNDSNQVQCTYTSDQINVQKRSINSGVTDAADEPVKRPKYEVDCDVVVIDSDDSDAECVPSDEQNNDIEHSDDDQLIININNNMKKDILMTIQTSCTDSKEKN